ncbi:uncharacterized protein LOC108902583 [Lates calcarifer]|uniref:Uncharacterized protein LOC108902583 n=1 Tax=Lates calcarifer TaxID=8187 RepID=A0AAJ7QMK5_LATCA|nr:uncharacterized protein LOC108902583 [Lates calcarifer]XP_018560024.1 uncharacterized protein LOC108902583 [Lates calcarifer]
MKFSLRIVVLLVLLGGTLADIEFDLSDFTDDDAKPTPPKPKEQPEKPNGGLDLLDPDVVPTKKPNKPSSGDSGGFDLNLEDDLGSDTNPKPDKPVVKPRKSGGDDGDPDLFDIIGGDYRPDGGRSGGRSGGGGGSFGDSDLIDVTGDYRPDDGRSGGDLKPSTAPADNCQGHVVKKLSTIIENQNQQLRLLQQLIAQSVNQRTTG